jgi:transcriptional regulator with XRE-family HTH domain
MKGGIFMNNQILSTKIKELRKIHGHTQDYVASALGIVRQTYSHYETGKRTPNPEILFKLAGLYNISVDDLLQLTMDIDRNIYYDAPAPTQSSEDLAGFLEYFNNPNNQKKYQMLNNLEKELLYYFEKISESDKKEIIEFTKIKSHKIQ